MQSTNPPGAAASVFCSVFRFAGRSGTTSQPSATALSLKNYTLPCVEQRPLHQHHRHFYSFAEIRCITPPSYTTPLPATSFSAVPSGFASFAASPPPEYQRRPSSVFSSVAMHHGKALRQAALQADLYVPQTDNKHTTPPCLPHSFDGHFGGVVRTTRHRQVFATAT